MDSIFVWYRDARVPHQSGIRLGPAGHSGSVRPGSVDSTSVYSGAGAATHSGDAGNSEAISGGPPENDGPSSYHLAPAGRQRQQPAGAELRELRRIEGESVSQAARSAGAEQWQEGDHGQGLVESAPAGNYGTVRPGNLWPRSPDHAESELGSHQDNE